jgi:hypothetical protein
LAKEDARLWKQYKIMEKMGWTVHEYRATPHNVIDQIWVFMETEAKYQEQKSNG